MIGIGMKLLDMIIGAVPAIIKSPAAREGMVTNNPKAIIAGVITASIALAASYGHQLSPVWTVWLTSLGAGLSLAYALYQKPRA